MRIMRNSRVWDASVELLLGAAVPVSVNKLDVHLATCIVTEMMHSSVSVRTRAKRHISHKSTIQVVSVCAQVMHEIHFSKRFQKPVRARGSKNSVGTNVGCDNATLKEG